MTAPMTAAELLAAAPDVPADRIPVCWHPRPGIEIDGYFNSGSLLPGSRLRFRRRAEDPGRFDMFRLDPLVVPSPAGEQFVLELGVA